MENKEKGLEKNNERGVGEEKGSRSEIASLLEENLRYSRELLEMSKDINKHIRGQNLWAILRFLLIAIPIILGFLYLPPFFNDLIEQYQSLLSVSYR